MSRTLHVDLTPSRRSKRLLQNGYYLQPPGEQAQLNEFSSEDEDDNVSVHSNNSSIFSGRAVHYNESPGSVVFGNKRRKRKGYESPRANLLAQTKSQSPVVKSRSQLAEASTSSRSTPNLSSTVSRQEKMHVTSNQSQTTRETKTTIHSVRQMSQSHRYASGESSSVTQSVLTTSQRETRNLTAGTSSSQEQNHLGTMTRNQSRYNAIGSGDQAATTHSSVGGERITSQTLSTSEDSQDHHSGTFEHGHNARQRKTQSRYSSESDLNTDEIVTTKNLGNDAEFSVPIILTKIWNILLLLLAGASSFIGNICGTIYQTVLKVFVFDVWWLSRKTSPLLVKAARYILVLLLLLLLLTSVYLFVTRFIGDNTETLLLPARSVVGILYAIPNVLTSITLFSGHGIANDEVVHESATKSMPVEGTESAFVNTNVDLEELMAKTELHFADKLIEVKKEVIALRQEQSEVSKKQQEIQLKISETSNQQEAADALIREKLRVLEVEISAMRINHTSTGRSLQSDIERLHGLLADKSQMSIKISELSTRIDAFDSRMNALNDLMMKSINGVDQRAGNATYIKEIAKMQFTENFLQVLKSTEGSSVDENSLSFLFIAWLKKQGFAREEEVEHNIRAMAVNNNLTLAVLEKKFMTQFERVKHDAKRHSSTITLEKIIERPAEGQNQPSKVVVEAEMRKWIQQELAIYSADRIGLADHALESAGGFVVSTRCSESYDRKTALVSLFGIPIYYNINTPRSVIQANTLPGECWSFKGSEGYIVIALSGAVQPTSFTLEHIPRELSPYGRIDSAPKDFSVLGLIDVYDYEGKVLGKYRYEKDGPVIQQYTATSETKEFFSFIELRVSSNWGHPDYTCLYRFRVHGQRKDSKSPPS